MYLYFSFTMTFVGPYITMVKLLKRNLSKLINNIFKTELQIYIYFYVF